MKKIRGIIGLDRSLHVQVVADDAAPIISGALRYEGTRTILTISRRHEQDPAKWVGVRDGKTIVLEHEVNSLSLTIQP